MSVASIMRFDTGPKPLFAGPFFSQTSAVFAPYRRSGFAIPISVSIPTAPPPVSEFVPIVSATKAVFPTVSEPSPTPNAKDLRRMVRAINRRVNNRVIQLPDTVTSGAEEYWGLPHQWTTTREAGDCEDIAIEKRMTLLAAGFPADRMNYAVVYKHNFGLHMVLIVHMDSGDYVLDSASARIDRWVDTKYVWLRIQSPKNPLAWYAPYNASAGGGSKVASVLQTDTLGG